MNYDKIKTLLSKRTQVEAIQNTQFCILCDELKDDVCQRNSSPESFYLKLARGHCEKWDRKQHLREFVKDSKRIKLVLYSSALLCGGAERWLVSLARNLDPKVFKICVAIRYPDLIDLDLFRKLKGVECIAFGNSAIQKISESADIFLAWDSFPKVRAKRSVFCSHGCDELNLELVRKYGNRDDFLFTAVSGKAASIWEKQSPTVIYNGSELERLTAPLGVGQKLREDLGFSRDTIVIGFVSRIVPGKNPHLVAETAEELRRRGYKAEALYVGDKPKDVEIKPQYTRLDKKEHLGAVYQAIDVFMLPSKSEAFSLAITEAWLTKTPVFTTRVGAIPELEKVHGKLVVSLGYKTLSDTVLEAVSKENQEVVHRAYNVAIENFTEERMAERWSNYLQSVL